jgi:hypothetical protein
MEFHRRKLDWMFGVTLLRDLTNIAELDWNTVYKSAPAKMRGHFSTYSKQMFKGRPVTHLRIIQSMNVNKTEEHLLRREVIDASVSGFVSQESRPRVSLARRIGRPVIFILAILVLCNLPSPILRHVIGLKRR